MAAREAALLRSITKLFRREAGAASNGRVLLKGSLPKPGLSCLGEREEVGIETTWAASASGERLAAASARVGKLQKTTSSTCDSTCVISPAVSALVPFGQSVSFELAANGAVRWGRDEKSGSSEESGLVCGHALRRSSSHAVPGWS